MRMNNCKYLNFIFILIITACQNTPPLDLTPKKKESLLKLKAVSQSEPNHYQVNLRWSPSVFSDGRSVDRTWILYRSQNSETAIPVMTLMPGQIEATDSQIEAGATYTYQLGFMVGEKLIAKEVDKITVPKDLVVATVVRGNNFTEYRRIFIERSGVIETGGQRLDLNAEELHSDGGMIRTFPETNSAETGHNGISPEILVVRVRRASGNLSVRAAGENGAKGVTGTTGAKGESGVDGQNPVVAKRTGAVPAPFCHSKAEDTHGKPGGQGQMGGAGGVGTSGGNSPKVYIQVDEPSHVEFKIERVAGKGGEAGDGGAGGKGGDGGKAGNKAPPCPDPQPGLKGPSGPQGPKGHHGIDGSTSEPICIKNGQQIEGQCSSFTEKNGLVF